MLDLVERYFLVRELGENRRWAFLVAVLGTILEMLGF
jgi:hypothetical protein